MSFVERSTEFRDWPIVSGMREMVKLDGESVGFRIGQQIDFVVEEVTQKSPRIVGANEVLSKQ